MDQSGRLVRSRALGAWLAISGNAKGRGKSISGRKLIAAVLTLASIAFLAPLALAEPTGGAVTAGSGAIAHAGTTTTITQNTQRLAIDWNTFNIAANEAVRFSQPNSSAIALNRILSASPSEILGSLSANGQVFFLNPNGVFFGQGAQVNVGGLVASTLSLSDADFMAGNHAFSNNGATGSVVNQGTLTAADGGYIALLGSNVSNQGVIRATLGTALLAAGDKVTLNLNNGSLLGYSIDQGALKALAENKQLIQADGGQVLLSAKAVDALSTAVVNNTGIIEARTIQHQGGVIKLLGDMQVGQVNVGGTLDASAPKGGDGGFIETSAAHVKVVSDAKVTTAAPLGLYGSWLIDPQDYNVAASGDITGATLSANLGTTSITLQSSGGGTAGSGNVKIDDGVSWGANTTLTLTASNNVNINANITATGDTAGLVINPNTANGAEPASGTGTFTLGNGASVTLSGLMPSLSIAGTSYTVINSLGAAGSVTATDLQGMSGNLAGKYALGSNIDAAETFAWNAGAGFAPVGNASTPFTGTFDGLGHTVSGLTINLPTADYVGLFGTAMGSVIRNVGLVGGSVSGSGYVGGLMGLNKSGTVGNAYATGSVTGSGYFVGGLVGRNDYGTVSNAYATGNVSGETGSVFVGGLVGLNNYGTVSNAYATGIVSGDSAVGGLVGHNNYGTVSNAYAAGGVSGSEGVGGLLGNNYGPVSNVYATGGVNGTSDVGGLVGYNNNYGHISNAYATGSVNGTTNVGGLVGWTYSGGTVSNSYWDTQTTGQASAVGLDHGTTNATGLTTAQMMQTATMPRLDFTNTWWLSPGNTRPFLRFEYGTTINNAHRLQLMAMYPGARYTLGADINMAELTNPSGMWNTTTGFAPVGEGSTPFTGTFDGLGHTISNLTINRPAQSYVGLFGFTNSGSVVRNVGLIGMSVSGAASGGGSNFVGGLVGYNQGTTINSYATGSVSGDGSGSSYVGGLVGLNQGTTADSYATGSVNGVGSGGGASFVGGLVGGGPGTISNSYSTGSVSGSGQSYVGGLVGYNYGATANSYATGSVSGVASGGGYSYVGGLAGINQGTTTNSYATGSVSGSGPSFVGGLVGYNFGTTTNSYATGSVSGVASGGGFSYVGGLVGYNYGTVGNSYWDTQTSGAATGVGTGVLTGPTGLPTAQMQQLATFSGWSIDDAGGTGAVWRIYEGNTYPLLRSFLTPLTVTANDAGKTYDGLAYSGGNGVEYGGFVNGETSGVLGGALAYGGTSQGAMNADSYTITPSGYYSNQQGYDISYRDGQLTVAPAALTVTANGAGKTYDGLAYSGGNGVLYSGLVNGETGAVLGGSLSYGGTSQGAVDAGSYQIAPGGLTSGNYTITFNNGALTVTPAALTVTANGAGKTYDGLAYSGGNGVLYSGLVNGETGAVLGGSLSYGGTSQGAVDAGSYQIAPGGLTSGNYTITFNNGQLTIRHADESSVALGGTTLVAAYDGVRQGIFKQIHAVPAPLDNRNGEINIVQCGVHMPAGFDLRGCDDRSSHYDPSKDR